MKEVQWERMFPDQLEAAISACPVVYFAYGLCEPHGPQNAVGLDAIKAHAICCRAARAHGGIVAPPDYWHIHEIGLYASWAAEMVGEARPWLTAVPPWIHFKNICYHLRAADALGFHAAISGDRPLRSQLAGSQDAARTSCSHTWPCDSTVCRTSRPTHPVLTTTASQPAITQAR